MKKKYIGIFLLVLICIVGTILIVFKDYPKIISEQPFKELITKSSDGDIIAFKDVTSFEWDDVRIYGPYSDPREDTDIKHMKKVSDSIKFSDAIFQLVFIKDNTAIRQVSLSRSYVNFDDNVNFEANLKGKISKEEGTFYVTRDGDIVTLSTLPNE